LPIATDNTGELLHQASIVAAKLFQPGQRYRKAGVIFTELLPKATAQRDMFDSLNRDRTTLLMNTIDDINELLGTKTLQFASQGTMQPWSGKCELRSRNYTTQWDQLLEVRAE
jgi:DNA polymerase V